MIFKGLKINKKEAGDGSFKVLVIFLHVQVNTPNVQASKVYTRQVSILTDVVSIRSNFLKRTYWFLDYQLRCSKNKFCAQNETQLDRQSASCCCYVPLRNAISRGDRKCGIRYQKKLSILFIMRLPLSSIRVTFNTLIKRTQTLCNKIEQSF